MKNIVEIKRSIKSIKNIKQTTRAMELISTAKMRISNEKYENNLRYFNIVRKVMKDILDGGGDIQHKYLREYVRHRAAFVVIASDTGMAGEYNQRILNYALEQVNNHEGPTIVYTVGAMGYDFFLRNGIKPEKRFLAYAKKPTIGVARGITSFLVNQYDENKIDEIIIIYTTHADGGINIASRLNLLPILKEDFIEVKVDDLHAANYYFEPSAAEVFNTLVPQYILGLTYSTMIQSVKCEHEERMEAMHTATKNANEMLGKLELEYHQARQEQITTELTEISSEALRSIHKQGGLG